MAELARPHDIVEVIRRLQLDVNALKRRTAGGGGGVPLSLSVTDTTTIDLTLASNVLSAAVRGTAVSDFFLPENYGAVGGAANDTVPVQAAINAAIAAGGGTVLLRDMFYTTALIGDSNVVLLGCGWGTGLTQIMAAGDPDNQYLYSVDGATDNPSLNKTGIGLYNMQLRGTCDVDFDGTGNYYSGAKQHIHLLRLSAVSDVTVSYVLFKGFRGDGFYLQGNEAGVARHNRNVKVLGSTFDGINHENRNGISVIDCDDFLADACTFKRMSHSTMPGAVDFEPNPANTFAVLRACRVTNSWFEDIGGLAGGVISVYLWGTAYTTEPHDFRFTGNTVRGCDKIVLMVNRQVHASASTPRHEVLWAHNNVEDCRQAWEVDGCHGFRDEDNSYKDTRYAGAIGYSFRCRDVVTDSDWDECAQFEGYVFTNYQGDHVTVKGTYHNCGAPPSDPDYPYGVIVRLEQRVANVTADAATDTLTLTAHGFTANQEVKLNIGTGGVMPGGLIATTSYYVRDGTANTFKLSATPGGAAIDITSNGTPPVIVSYPRLQTTSHTTFDGKVTQGTDGALPGRTTQITDSSSLHVDDSTDNRYRADIDFVPQSANFAGLDAPQVTGARSGNAALADLLTDLADLGHIRDGTTAGIDSSVGSADFKEGVQDVMGNDTLAGSSTLTWAYADATTGYISGSVVDSPALAGQNGAFYRDRANHTGTQSYSTLSGLSRGDLITVNAGGITRLAIGTVGKVLGSDGTDIGWVTPGSGVTDHGALTGLGDDDHAIYPLLAGRGAEQILKGGVGAGDALTLSSTNHATKGAIYLGSDYNSAYIETTRRLGIGHSSAGASLHVKGVAAQTDPLMLVEDSAGADRLTLSIAGQLGVPIATGTAPLSISSTTKVANLNVDLLDDQTGSYYLDRANHTGTQLASTVSDFTEATQDAVGAFLTDSASVHWIYDDPGNTYQALIQGAGIDHDSLAELLDDDHTQYALLAGRAGGQVYQGGIDAADNLTLEPSSHASPTGDVIVDLSASTEQELRIKGGGTWTTTTSARIRFAEAFAVGASGAFKALQIDSPITYSGTPVNAGLQVFTFIPSITARTGGEMRGAAVFRDNAVINLVDATAHGTLSTIGNIARGWTSFESRKAFNPGTGGATGRFPEVDAIVLADTVDTGWTIDNYRALYFTSPAGAGTITAITALDLADFGARTAAPISLRSAGPLVEMRHAGLVNIGNAVNKTLTASVADDYGAGLRLDPGYTGAFTVTRHNYIDALTPSLAGSAVVTDACLVRFDAAAGTHKAVDGATTKTTPGGVDAWVKVNVNGTIHYVPAYTSKTA